MQHHLLQQAPKATGTIQAASCPPPPFLAALSSSPAHRMQCLMPLPSRERERERKCHLVNDKLFQSHSSDTKCPGPRTAQASSLWVGGRQLSTSRVTIRHHGQAPPARPAHLTRQECSNPAGRPLPPVPTTLANYPLGLQLRHCSLSCSKAQRDLEPSRRPPAWQFSKGLSAKMS